MGFSRQGSLGRAADRSSRLASMAGRASSASSVRHSSTFTFATWNPADNGAQSVLSNGNLTTTAPTNATAAGVRSTISKTSGKWYWETTISRPSTTHRLTGVALATEVLAQPGATADGWGMYGLTGLIYNNSIGVAAGAVFGNGDIISLLLDQDAGTVAWYKNGVAAGIAQSTGWAGQAVFAMTGCDNTTGASGETTNFGATDFAFTVPAGYTGLF